MCATIISTPDVNTLYNLLLPTKQHLIFSHNVSQDGRIQKEGSSTIPLCTISLNHPATWVLLCTPLQLTPQIFNGLRSGDWDGHGRSLILCLVNHFCVDLATCLGSLSCWKTQWRPIFSFRAEATRFCFKMSWYFKAFMMPCTLTRFLGPLEEKQAHSITDPPPYFTVGMRCFSAYSSFVFRQTHSECLLPKTSILVSSDQSTRSQLKPQYRLANSRRLRLWLWVRKVFFRACLPNSLLACR